MANRNRRRVRQRAYEIWEAEGRLHGDDLTHWFRAEAEFPPITVTFDTNTLDRAVRPERFPKDHRRFEYLKVRDALACGAIRGFFCETLVIIEGVQKRDRAQVLASTRIRTEILPEIPGPDGVPAIPINLNVEEQRPPPPAEMLARVQAALALGFRVLGAPRIGQTRIADPNRTIYVDENDDNSIIGKRLDRYHDLAVALEGRGVGASQIQKLAKQFAQRDGVSEAWYHSLQRAKDVHEENAVKRACAEWADGDSIAAHFGYGIDFFCTEDAGKSSGAPSILDAANRSWVEKAYGVRFINLTELAQVVS